LVLAGELGLVWGLGAFLGPLLLGGPSETTLSVEVHRQAFEYGHWPRAAAGAVLLIAAVGLCLAAYALLTRAARGGK
jgi:ABC-type spermidine/putrescine transport system permease subunit I